MTQTDNIWPGKNLTEVPYAVYDDEQIYARERERIFQGPTWNILGLECEVPEAGDYKTTFLGDIPIVVHYCVSKNLEKLRFLPASIMPGPMIMMAIWWA